MGEHLQIKASDVHLLGAYYVAPDMPKVNRPEIAGGHLV